LNDFSKLMRILARDFSNRTIATSAIRTKPSRTYTPGEEKEDGEGSHVPYELAKLARKKGRDWSSISAEFKNFGNLSDMFNELHVKSFGRNISDPFQIQLSLNGPRTNIVDMGYGTSQILPIIFLIASSRRKTSFLIQQPEVHLHPKAQAALGQYIVESTIKHTVILF